MEKTCNNCVHCDIPKRKCRFNPAGFLPNDWTAKGHWPTIDLGDWCGKWDGGERATSAPRITSSITCPVCGLAWTALDGESWTAVIEAKKTHECIPLSFVNTYPTNV